MQTSSKKYAVDIWSDYVCPWCWIAKRRFEKALEQFPEKNDVQVNFWSYRLAANHTPEPMIAALKRKLGTPHSADAMMDTVRKYGQGDGLDYRFDTMQFGDTTDAHVLVKAVDDADIKKRLVEALYAQSTTHGQSLFDRDSLTAIAKTAGVSDEVIALAWSSPGLRAQMIEDEQFAAQLGSGVPMFVFDNRLSMSGAQPELAFLEALEQMRVTSTREEEVYTGQVCGIDGCKT